MQPEQMERALGCWLGQLAGDALGCMVEAQTSESIWAQWPNGLRDMGDGMVWNTLAGQPSDDSELAMELAYALKETYPRFEPNVVAFHYRNWRDSQPFSAGKTIRQAVNGHYSVNLSFMAESFERQADKNSLANGALMRQSPLGIWGYAKEPTELAEYARLDARLTHPHPVCREASAVFVVTLAQVISQGLSAKEAYECALDFQKQYGTEPSVLDAITRARAPELVKPPYSPHSGYVLLTLHNAFYQLLHANDLESVIVDTVMLGGDTDTNAAVAGALAGAVYGSGQVPLRWRNAFDACAPDKDLGAKQPRPERYWPGHYRELVLALVEAPKPKKVRAKFGEW